MNEYQNIHNKAWKKDRRNTVLLLKDIVRLCPYKFHKTTSEQVKKHINSMNPDRYDFVCNGVHVQSGISQRHRVDTTPDIQDHAFSFNGASPML